MGKFNDLSNKQFGDLLAINRHDKKYDSQVIWNCLCKCGNYRLVRSGDLRSGLCTACYDCSKVNRIIKSNNKVQSFPPDQMIGKIYGNLKILNLSDNNDETKLTELLWICECNCGNIIERKTSSLIKGWKLHCGHVSEERKNRLNSPVWRMYKEARSRAKKNNLKFDIELSDIIIPKYCEVLGIKLICGLNKACSNSPSLDRIDNTKGYIKENIKVISLKANRMKNNASIEEVEAILRYMKENTS